MLEKIKECRRIFRRRRKPSTSKFKSIFRFGKEKLNEELEDRTK
jgi:hypothetical protein